MKRDCLLGQPLVFIPITMGIKTDTYLEVLKPKLVGKVVTLGNHLLKDGSKIILPDQSSKAKTDLKKRPPIPK